MEITIDKSIGSYASGYYTNNDSNLSDIKELKAKVTILNRRFCKATWKKAIKHRKR